MQNLEEIIVEVMDMADSIFDRFLDPYTEEYRIELIDYLENYITESGYLDSEVDMCYDGNTRSIDIRAWDESDYYSISLDEYELNELWKC